MMMRVLMLLLVFLSAPAASGGSDDRYLVITLSVGEVDPQSEAGSGLAFLKVYFDTHERVPVSAGAGVDAVYAQIDVTAIPPSAGSSPGEPGEVQGLRSLSHARGDGRFRVTLRDVRVLSRLVLTVEDLDTGDGVPLELRFEAMEAYPFDANGDGTMSPSADPARYRSDVEDYFGTGHVGDAPFTMRDRMAEPTTGVFAYHVETAGSLPMAACLADLNNDGTLNFFDLSLFIDSCNAGCPE